MTWGCLFVHVMRMVGGCVFCFLNRPLKKMSATHRHFLPLPPPLPNPALPSQMAAAAPPAVAPLLDDVAIMAWREPAFGEAALRGARVLDGSNHSPYVLCGDTIEGDTPHCRLHAWQVAKSTVCPDSDQYEVKWHGNLLSLSPGSAIRVEERWLRLTNAGPEKPEMCALEFGAFGRQAEFPDVWVVTARVVLGTVDVYAEDVCLSPVDWLGQSSGSGGGSGGGCGLLPPPQRTVMNGRLLFPAQLALAAVSHLLPRAAHTAVCVGAISALDVQAIRSEGQGARPLLYKPVYGGAQGSSAISAVTESTLLPVAEQSPRSGGSYDCALVTCPHSVACPWLVSCNSGEAPFFMCEPCKKWKRNTLRDTLRRAQRVVDTMDVGGVDSDEEAEEQAEEEVLPVLDPIVALTSLYQPLFASGERHMLALEGTILDLEVRRELVDCMLPTPWLVLHTPGPYQICLSHTSLMSYKKNVHTTCITGATAGVREAARG